MDLQFKETLKNSYNENAKLRNCLSIEPWKLKGIDYFVSFLEKGEQARILDLGAGTGQHSLYMKEIGLKAYEMDFTI